MFGSRNSANQALPLPAQPIGSPDFWEDRFLPVWLPLLVGLGLGIGAAVLIANDLLFLLVPLAMIVPVAVLFVRYPFAAVMIWIAVFPYFVATPSTSTRLMFWLLHRLMIPGALMIVILSDWLRISKRPAVRFGRAELAMLIFVLVGILNIILLTPSPEQAFVRFYDRLLVPFSMYALTRLAAPSERDLKRFAWIGLITIIAESIIGLLGWFMPQVLPPQWLNRAGERTVGTFGNPAVFTSTLIFLALVMLHYALQQRSRGIRAIAFITFSLVYFSVFFSFSRGSWLGGALVIMGLAFVYPRVILRWTAVTMLVVLALGTTLLASEVTWALTRLNDEDTAQGRVLGAATALRMIEAKPWLGWGFANYDRYDEQFKTRVQNLPPRDEQTSHNTFLLFMAEMGTISLPLYAIPTIWWLLQSRKVWRRMPQQGMFSWHLLAMLWLLLLDHFVVSNFMDMIQANLFGTTIWWLVLGLIANLVYPHLRSSDLAPPRWATQSLVNGPQRS